MYSYANHDFGAGGTFSFGGVTVAANRDHDSEEEVLTSMNANEFQVYFYIEIVGKNLHLVWFLL